MWYLIVEEEFERFLTAVENNEISKRMRFCDCYDFEDEFSHNDIRKAMRLFYDKAKKYIEKAGRGLRVEFGVECVFVEQNRQASPLP